MKKSSVWSRDFKLVTLATIIAVIGGEAINLPLSLYVFAQTKSTLLSSILFISGMLPDVVLPIFIAPFIDRLSKKKIVLALNSIMAAVFLIFALLISKAGFNYNLYLTFSFLVGTISVVVRLAYTAWYPDIIPIGFEQKGYAVSSTIYPTVMIVMAPIATFLYEHTTMPVLFLIVVVLTVISIIFQSMIKVDPESKDKPVFNFKTYREDTKSGFKYLLREKGIRNIYSYMSITFGVGDSVQLMAQAYFQTVSFLTTTMFAFLKSAETFGRILSGLVQYKVNIPPKKRYNITKFVYTFYNTMDMLLLFLPYPLMLVNRFAVGFMGTTSATIREASVQSYLPRNMRAKVSAVFSVIISLLMILFQLLAGYLGTRLDYRTVNIVLSTIGLIAVYIFIARPANLNRKVYESVRTDSAEISE